MKKNIESVNAQLDRDANLYSIKSILIMLGTFFIIWILNILDIFIVDIKLVTISFLISLGLTIIMILISIFVDLSKPWCKYFILSFLVAITTVIGVCLTYHTVLVCILPILFSAMYKNKKLTYFAYFLTVISLFIIVFVGYYYGLCDANMAVLTKSPLKDYIQPDGTLYFGELNDNVFLSLTLFYVFPRCMIIAAFIPVITHISNTISKVAINADSMKKMAETDEMTGLFNRSQFLHMIEEVYPKTENIGVIYWDINFLKTINDNLGHEHGDFLITSVAKTISAITSDKSKAYRTGGDEFIMIIEGGNQDIINAKIAAWKTNLEVSRKITNTNIYVSYGYSCGLGKDINELINEADKKMYENKREFHENFKGDIFRK